MVRSTWCRLNQSGRRIPDEGRMVVVGGILEGGHARVASTLLFAKTALNPIPPGQIGLKRALVSIARCVLARPDLQPHWLPGVR